MKFVSFKITAIIGLAALTCLLMAALQGCVYTTFTDSDTKFRSFAIAPPFSTVDSDAASLWYEIGPDGEILIDTGRRTEGMDLSGQNEALSTFIQGFLAGAAAAGVVP